MSKLPFDLVLEILGLLTNEQETMSSCSLVCRDWTWYCQTSLLQSVKFLYYKPWQTKGDLSRDVGYQLANFSPHLATRVKHLTVQSAYIQNYAGRLWLTPEIVELYDNLEILTLREIDFKPESRKSDPVRKRLARLELQELESMFTVVAMLNLFPTIEELRISHMRQWDDYDEEHPGGIPAQAHVYVLSLHEVTKLGLLLRSLVSLIDMTKLQRYSLTISGRTVFMDPETFSPFLQYPGLNLEELSFRAYGGERSTLDKAMDHIRHLSTLQHHTSTLRLSIYIIQPPIDTSEILQDLDICPREITHLSLYIAFQPDQMTLKQYPADEFWEPLMQTLNSFPVLKYLCLTFVCWFHPRDSRISEKAESYIWALANEAEESLTEFRSRGALRFQYRESTNTFRFDQEEDWQSRV